MMMDKIDWSKAPEGAKFAAWRKGTVKPMVCWYRIVDGGWHYWYEEDSGPWSPCADGSPAHHPLEPRPSSDPMNNEHQDHKEGEGVKWDGEGNPPAGTVCRIEEWVPSGEWILCDFDYRIDYVGHSHVVATTVGTPREVERVFTEVRFIPLKSRRDKVIEAAMKIVYDRCGARIGDDVDRRALVAMYDRGALKLPEVEE